MSSNLHSYAETSHQLTRIPTRLPQNMDQSKRERHKGKKDIKLSRGVAPSGLPTTRYKWPSEPQNVVQYVKADYLVRFKKFADSLELTYLLKSFNFLLYLNFDICPVRNKVCRVKWQHK